MRLLAIESSYEAVSVAVATDGEVAERFEHAPRGHAERLLPWIETLLADADLGVGDLDAIAVGVGPGSFTSLRLGIGVTQGLAWGADIPVVPISSLAATVQAVIERVTGTALVAMDARMNELYCGAFTSAGGLARAERDERLVAPGALVVPADPWTAVGNGFERYAPAAALAGRAERVIADAWPTATAVIELARNWLSEHDPIAARDLEPVYLRNKVANKPGEGT